MSTTGLGTDGAGGPDGRAPGAWLRRVGVPVALATLLLAGGAVASAQTVAQPINACVSKGGLLAPPSGSIRVVRGPADCSSTENPLSWNTAGPPGPQGSAGAPGPEGVPGPPGFGEAFTAEAPGTVPATEDGTVTVVTLPVPAGSYVLHGKVSVQTRGASGAIGECDLEVDGVAEDTGYFQFTSSILQAGVVGLLGTTTVGAPAAITITCFAGEDFSTYDISRAVIVATPVGAVR